MSNTELKIVVDVSKPLKEVGAVSALLAVYNAAWDVVRDLVMQPLTCDDPIGGRMFTLSTDLHDKLRQAFIDAGEFGAIDQIFNRQPAIVGAETQVGQFVTASPAYGVYEGQKHFHPESVAAAHPQGFKAMESDASALNHQTELAKDGQRYRTLLRCLEIDSDMSEKGYKPSDGEVEAMRRLFADKFTTKETANAAIDGIISEKLLGEHQ